MAKRGRPKGSTNKKKPAEVVECEVIDGLRVCPVCKTQDYLEIKDYNTKDKKGDCYFISDFICTKCLVMMKFEMLLSEL